MSRAVWDEYSPLLSPARCIEELKRGTGTVRSSSNSGPESELKQRLAPAAIKLGSSLYRDSPHGNSDTGRISSIEEEAVKDRLRTGMLAAFTTSSRTQSGMGDTASPVSSGLVPSLVRRLPSPPRMSQG